jgi:hypothetical protein
MHPDAKAFAVKMFLMILKSVEIGLEIIDAKGLGGTSSWLNICKKQTLGFCIV